MVRFRVGYEEIFTDTFRNKLKEITKLLEQAYTHAMEDPASYYGKSSEGLIRIEIPPYFWQSFWAERRPEIQIYSYMLGPYRMHTFRDIDSALEEVRKWHTEEMLSEENGEI